MWLVFTYTLSLGRVELAYFQAMVSYKHKIHIYYEFLAHLSCTKMMLLLAIKSVKYLKLKHLGAATRVGN